MRIEHWPGRDLPVPALFPPRSAEIRDGDWVVAQESRAGPGVIVPEDFFLQEVSEVDLLNQPALLKFVQTWGLPDAVGTPYINYQALLAHADRVRPLAA